MKHALIILLIFSCFGFTLSAEKKDSLWKSNGNFNITFGQSSFTNWSKGGENNISGNLLMHYSIDYKNKKTTWDNNIELDYGGLVNENRNYKKTNDKIYLSSKYGLDLGEKLDFSYYINFRSQFTKGFKYPNDSVYISKFMAPGYFMIGLGMDYKPKKYFSILFSPLTNKLTLVNDSRLANEGAFGVTQAKIDGEGNITKAGEKILSENGGFIKVNFTKEFKDLKAKSKLELFYSYANTDDGIDVNWSTVLAYNISELFAATLSLDVVYDKDAIIKEDIDGDGVKEELGPRTQVREILSFGLSFKL